MRWLVADTLYCRGQFFCSHLDSYSHYLREAGEDAVYVCLNGEPASDVFCSDPWRAPDVLLVLDQFDRCADTPATLHVAQVAAVCSPMPWEVRRPDGSPAYDLILSSIPAMVARARAAGCRAEYMPLAFDVRARVCGMGVQRDLGAIFIGTVGPNHRRRARLLEQLADLVTVLPPVFGREYFRTLARARVVFNVHAEWAEGAANNMRIYEAIGMGAALVTDGTTDGGEDWPDWDPDYTTAEEAREALEELLERPDDAMMTALVQQEQLLVEDCYEHRIPRLIELVKFELMRRA